jgi:hypothetical protein
MAWYYETFACGCDGRVNVIGKEKDRQWKIDNKFSQLCLECWTKKRQEEIKAENEKSAQEAKELGLPELTGSEKQVAWATTIRDKFIKDFKEKTKNTPDVSRKRVSSFFDWIMTTRMESKIWIEDQSPDFNSLYIQYKELMDI